MLDTLLCLNLCVDPRSGGGLKKMSAIALRDHGQTDLQLKQHPLLSWLPQIRWKSCSLGYGCAAVTLNGGRSAKTALAQVLFDRSAIASTSASLRRPY